MASAIFLRGLALDAEVAALIAVAACRRDAENFPGGAEEAERLAVGLRRTAIRLRN